MHNNKSSRLTRLVVRFFKDKGLYSNYAQCHISQTELNKLLTEAHGFNKVAFSRILGVLYNNSLKHSNFYKFRNYLINYEFKVSFLSCIRTAILPTIIEFFKRYKLIERFESQLQDNTYVSEITFKSYCESYVSSPSLYAEFIRGIEVHPYVFWVKMSNILNDEIVDWLTQQEK